MSWQSFKEWISTDYSKMNASEAAGALLSDGYRQVSNRFQMVARVDISDAQLASQCHNRKITELDRDCYRRCESDDGILNVPREIMSIMRHTLNGDLLTGVPMRE